VGGGCWVGTLLPAELAASASSVTQVKEYYGEYNTLERGKGAVMKESQKVGDQHYALAPNRPTACLNFQAQLVHPLPLNNQRMKLTLLIQHVLPSRTPGG
jgi:hypothetical protein